ncbi:threonine aldolase [Rhodocyclus tenuis]|uniref:threonine aldolase family protein n=1 Tax=Rhodocyclus gracilis TaxID=2929842 RepID=UPI00129897E1|nr:low specificity L-threonine aldolase [Rhodocyclus gracilis]MRD71980.1 threonine aldolase [Rhodocyclus gracilis]
MNAPTDTQQLASDNYAGICAEAFAHLEAANAGHAIAYGDDVWTARAKAAIEDVFETACEVHFVFNGTAANSLALSAICQSYHSVICHELAHIETDECGGPEFFSNGSKLLLGGGANGKLTPAAVEAIFRKRSDIHYPKPQAVSLTQATEVGTVYTPDELAALQATARRLGLHLHMDGARLANALASLGARPKEITWQAGIDVLCFGGTKNGLAVGEAVVFFNTALARDFAYRCKQAGQLASKMRFVSAPWLGLLDNDTWQRNAAHANAMAQRLAKGLEPLPGVHRLFPVEANSVFVSLPEAVITRLHAAGWRFYTFIGAGGVRLMTSWNTREETVDAFIATTRQALGETTPAPAAVANSLDA